jgi:hypothetical protein
VSAWTPEGLNGQLFMTMGRHTPPPPPGFQPPVLWGSEDHVRALFAGAAGTTCERRTAPNGVHAESVEKWVDYLEATLGPVVLAKRALEPEGRWAPARDDMVALFERFNEAGDGGLHAEPEYLLTVVRKGE